MTINLLHKPEWLTTDTLDGDTLLSFYWERKDPGVTPEQAAAQAADPYAENFTYYRLMAIGVGGLYEFNRAGLCIRAKAHHPIKEMSNV